MLLRVGNARRIARRIAVLGARQLFNLWLNGLVASDLVPDHLRWVLLRASGVRVGRSLIDAHCFIGSRKVSIGARCSINRGAFLDGSAAVVIGDDVSIGMNVVVVTGSHQLGGAHRRAGELQKEPVRIGDGAWIGANAIVLPGVTIGAGAVVGAGSVVMKDVAPNTLVMGNPARIARRLDETPAAATADTSAATTQ